MYIVINQANTGGSSMEVLKEEFTKMGWKKEIMTTYRYKNEVIEILNTLNLKIGENRWNGVELNVFDNGGEMTISIPNARKYYVNLPFDLCREITDIEYFEMIYKMMNKFEVRINELNKKLRKL